MLSRGRLRPIAMRRTVAPIYALILLETLVWIAIVPLAPTFSDELRLSGVETGMILAAASLAALVVAFPLGLIADRLGSRRVTIASAFLFTLATFGQGLADDFWSVLLARAAFGVAFGALWGAGASWLSDSLSDARRPKALGAAVTVSGVGFTAGPVFSGVLADRYGTGTPFLLVAVAAAVVTAGLVVAAPATPTRPPTQRLREMLSAARRDELVLAGIAIIVLIGLVGGGVNLLVPLQLRENNVSAGEIGLLFSAASAVYTVVSAVVARMGARSATLRVGGTAALLTGLSIVLVLLSSSTMAAVAFVLLRAPFWATMDTIIYPLGAAGAHRSSLGRGSVMGLLTVGWAVAATIGPLLAGGIADVLGERAAYAVMIGCCGAIGIWLLWTDRNRAGSRGLSGKSSRQMARDTCREARTQGVPICRHIGATEDAASRCVARARWSDPLSGQALQPDRRAAVDLARLYGARDHDELREEYDRIASAYDAELVDGMGYRSPAAVRAAAQRLLPRDGRILDVGAGTGLLGVALAEAGFTRLDALDLSAGMLAEAAHKNVYDELHEAKLGDELALANAAYDGVVASGVLTTGHAPANCLDELVRVTRRGGHVIFTLRADQLPPGFEGKIAELEEARRWELVERGEEFQALPIGEPEVLVRVWAFRVT